MTTTFLRDWFQDCPGLIELRHLPSRDRSFHEGLGGMRPRKRRRSSTGAEARSTSAWRRGTGRAGRRRTSSRSPAYGATWTASNTPKEMAENLLRDFPLRPTYIIASGGGTCTCTGNSRNPSGGEYLPQVEAILRGIARILHGDMASAEAAHVLRPVGMLNRKYDPPRRVEVIESNPEALYNLSDFDLYADAELPEPTTTPSTGDAPLRRPSPGRDRTDAPLSPGSSRGRSRSGTSGTSNESPLQTCTPFSMAGGIWRWSSSRPSPTSNAKYTAQQMASLVGKPPLCINEALCGGKEKCAVIQKAGGASPIKLATWREEKKGPEIVVLEEMQAESARDLLIDSDAAGG